MNRIYALCSLLLVALVSSAYVVKETKPDTDFDIYVSPGGTPTKAISIDGTTGIPNFPNGAIGLGAPTVLVVNGDAEANGVPSGWGKAEEGGTEPSGSAIDSGANLTAIARTTTGGELINGTGTWKLAKAAANAQGSGWYYDFEVPEHSSLRNVLNELSFNYRMSAAAAAGTFRVYIRDMTNGANITPSFTSCGGGSTPALTIMTTTCNAKLSWLGTAGTEYRLYVFVSTTDATAVDIYLDDLFIGQRGVQVGPGQGPITSYTPNAGVNQGLGTLSAVDLTYRRVGESMVISGRFSTGTVAAAVARLAIPDGFTIATFSQSPHVVGKWAGGSTSGSLPKQGSVIAASGTNYLSFGLDAASATGSAFTPVNGSSLFENSQTVEVVNVVIPIAEWAGGVAYGENRVTYLANSDTSTTVSNTTAFIFGHADMVAISTGGNTAVKKRVRAPFDARNAKKWVEFRANATATWLPAAEFGAGWSRNDAGTTTYGVALASVSETDIDVSFYSAAAPGISWDTNWDWRVVVASPGQPVGFGLADATTPGLYRAGQAPGTATNDNAATGAVGEYVESTNSGAGSWGPASGVTGNITSITLTAGDWDVSFLFGAGGGTFTGLTAWLSTASASTAGRELGSNYAGVVGGTEQKIMLPNYRVKLSSTATYYLNGTVTYSSTPTYSYRLSARRVR